MQDKKIGFVGAGNMAAALIKGLLHSGTVAPVQIQASDVRDEHLAGAGARKRHSTTRDNAALSAWADVIVLAVKPQVIDKVMPAVAPGVRPRRWWSRSPRASPSTARGASSARTPGHSHHAQHGGHSLWRAPRHSARGHATEEDLAVARRLFEATGRVVVLDESLLDAVTGLSGSGPAYVMLIIEALADGGVKLGLHRDTALLLAAQTVFGSAKLLLETGEHPGRLKDMVHQPRRHRHRRPAHAGGGWAADDADQRGGKRDQAVDRARRKNGRTATEEPAAALKARWVRAVARQRRRRAGRVRRPWTKKGPRKGAGGGRPHFARTSRHNALLVPMAASTNINSLDGHLLRGHCVCEYRVSIVEAFGPFSAKLLSATKEPPSPRVRIGRSERDCELARGT